jgi:ferredoxin-type protein NapH
MYRHRLKRGICVKQNRRLLPQFGFFLLQNPFISNFVNGKIYQGHLKTLCSPGLNCYSCPAAAVSCPLGAIQYFFSGVRHRVSFYVIGFLLMTGVVLGRFICAFVCPMGLLQDLLYLIKMPKIVRRLKYLQYVKYVILSVFVVFLPLTIINEFSGLGQPWFCKFICPSGTLFGAIPLVLINDFLRNFIGAQFFLKLMIAINIIIAAIFVYRIFCRMFCPLGAIYALFNKISILHLQHDKEKCLSCKACVKACQIKIDPTSQTNSPECVRCGKCVNACEHNALSCKIRGRQTFTTAPQN